jgi:tetratricopeptide (TPR) repeat protein
VASAVQTLQEGVETDPKNWTLWYWLGNHYADADRIDDSREVFQKALECPDVERSIVHLSIAMAFCQQEKYAEGLEHVEKIEDDSLWLRGQALKIDSLINLERQDEAIALGKEILGKTKVDDDSRGHLARIQSLVGCAIWGAKKDREAALQHAWKAIETDRSDPTALWLIREIENRTSPSAKYMRLLIEGAWEVSPDPDAGEPACYTIYDVVADDREEALRYIAPFEIGTVPEEVNVKRCEILEGECAKRKGVYGAMRGYSYLSQEGEGS